MQSEGEEDYLSNLPDELLRHILSFLPTIDSIRTSVLARRWRHVWTSVPVIDFSYLPELKSGLIDFSYLLHQKSGFIDRFIASRGGGSVSRLRLSGLGIYCDYAKSHDARGGESVSRLGLSVLGIHRENLYKLVKYAKTHDARHVTLIHFSEQCRLSLFELLFDWPSLVSLNLQVVKCENCTFSKCIFRLSNLKTLSLELRGNTIRNESLAKLLSGCPVLEELTLNAGIDWDDELIRIEAPNLLRLTLKPTPWNFQINCQKLEYLRIHPHYNFKYMHVEAPSLISVRLYNIWRFRTFPQTLCDVTAVAITLSDGFSGSTAEFSGKYKAVVPGFPIFHNLLELKIEMHVAEKLSLDIVLDLLRCAPNLQSFALTAYKKRRCHDDFDEWEKNSSSRINQPLDHLKRVSVNIKCERIRSAFLKTLSDRVPAWDRVTVVVAGSLKTQIL